MANMRGDNPEVNAKACFDYDSISAITDAVVRTVSARPGVGLQWRLTNIVITNKSTTVPTVVHILPEFGGPKFSVDADVNGGGCSTTFPIPTALRIGNNQTIRVQCQTAGAEVYISLAGYKEPFII